MTQRFATPAVTNTYPVTEDATGPLLLRGLAFGLPLALLLWFVLGVFVMSVLR